jgi:hypothetical protein
VLAGALAGAAARAGVVVEQEQREPGAKAATGRTVVSLDTGRVRVETATTDGEKQVLIFRAERRAVWILDPGEGTYYELSAAQVEKMRARMESAQREMAEQLAQLPPEQRRAVEQMMGQRMGGAAPLEVRALGGTQTVGTFTCARYDLLRGGERLQEVCAAPLEQLHMAAEEFASLAELGRLFEPLGQQAPSEQWNALEKLDGFPVKTVTYRDGQPVLEERVVRAERQTLVPNLFELPPGYRRVEPESDEP